MCGQIVRSRGVAGVYAPAFVERIQSWQIVRAASDVSLGFMLQPSLSAGTNPTWTDPVDTVSLGFMLQPSLSVQETWIDLFLKPCVAGVYAPAFVERLFDIAGGSHPPAVSLGFMLQPSLSAAMIQFESDADGGVAGVYAPAFVERLTCTKLGKKTYGCRWGLCSSLR